MFCGQYPALYYLHHQWYELPSPSSSLHPQGEERTLRGGLPLALAGCPLYELGYLTPLWGGWMLM